MKLRQFLVVAMAALLVGAVLVPRSAHALSSTGDSRWVVLPCRFQDSTPTPFVTSQKLREYFSHAQGLTAYFNELSNGKLNVQAQVQEWKTLSGPVSAFNMNDGTAMFDACTKLHDPDVNFSQFHAVMLIMDGRGGAHLGGSTNRLITLDGKTESWPYAAMLKSDTLHQGVMAHEMLHAYNLPDGMGQSTNGNSIDAMGNDHEFVTFHDVMAFPCAMGFGDNIGSLDGPYGCIPGHTRALYKYRLGWIPEKNVCTFEPARGTQSFKLETSVRPISQENCWMVRIPVPYASGQYFIAEARFKRGFDGPLARRGVIVTRTWGELGDANTALYAMTVGPSKLDSLGQTMPDMDGTVHEPGETYTNDQFCFKLFVEKHNAARSEWSYSITVQKTCY